MSDAEIIKALECCTTKPRATCKNCPYFLGNGRCKASQMQRHALDLINRQKAEIEILKNIGDHKTKELLRYDGFIRELHDKLKAAKAEAIKEYTKKLEAKLYPLGMVDSGRYLIQAMAVKTQIDRVKEKMLKGGDNDETKR